MLSALLTQPPNLVRCDTADFHGFRAQGTTAALGVYANQLVLVNYVSEAQEALPIAAPFDDDDVALISFTGHIVTQQAQHYTVSRMV